MPGIMTYDQWMRRTRRGPTRPRSEELRSVDFALRNYTTAPSTATLDLLASATDMWAKSKDDPARSIRNSDGAVTELLDGIRSAKQSRPAPTAAPAARPAASASAPAIPKPPALPTFTNVKAACGIFKHPNRDNVTWEGFTGDRTQALSRAYDRAIEAGALAAESMRSVAEGRRSLARDLYVKWFGEVDPTVMPKMVHSANLMVVAMKTRPVTFVLRHPKWQFDYEDPSAPAARKNNVLGLVFNAGADASKGILPHHTGSGMRIYLGSTVQDKVSDDYYSTHTIYHELSHKVIETSDFGSAPSGKIVDVYGEKKCLNLAKRQPDHARQLADSWSFYAMSFLKDWAV